MKTERHEIHYEELQNVPRVYCKLCKSCDFEIRGECGIIVFECQTCGDAFEIDISGWTGDLFQIGKEDD
jgi:hypothetical protein